MEDEYGYEVCRLGVGNGRPDPVFLKQTVLKHDPRLCRLCVTPGFHQAFSFNFDGLFVSTTYLSTPSAVKDSSA